VFGKKGGNLSNPQGFNQGQGGACQSTLGDDDRNGKKASGNSLNKKRLVKGRDFVNGGVRYKVSSESILYHYVLAWGGAKGLLSKFHTRSGNPSVIKTSAKLQGHRARERDSK